MKSFSFQFQDGEKRENGTCLRVRCIFSCASCVQELTVFQEMFSPRPSAGLNGRQEQHRKNKKTKTSVTCWVAATERENNDVLHTQILLDIREKEQKRENDCRRRRPHSYVFMYH